MIGISTAGCSSDTNEDQVQKIETDENSQKKGTIDSEAAEIGDTVTLSPNDIEEYKVTIKEIKQGDNANNLVKSASESNRDPSAGHEYLLVKANVAYTKGEDKLMMTRSTFVACCDEDIEQSLSIELPEDYNEFSGWVEPGENKEGWLAFEVPVGKEVIIKYKPRVSESRSAYISVGK